LREEWNALFIRTEKKNIYRCPRSWKMSKSKYNVNARCYLHRIRCGYLACMKCFRTIRTSETLEHSRNFEFWFLEKIMAFVFLMKMVWLLLTHQQRQLEIIAQNHQESSWGYWRISFNTSVSQFMICVNELSTQNCHSCHL
jgi:leucyl-tRNA synthetase